LSRFSAMRRTASLAESLFGDFAMRSFPSRAVRRMMAEPKRER